MTIYPETFSVVFSIRAFLIDLMTAGFPDLTLFLSPVSSPYEKELMEGLDRYLKIDILEGEISWDQPFDVSFRLWCKDDPSTLWLQRTSSTITKMVMTEKTHPGLNMIALLDFDRLIGQTSIQTFYQTGVLPANLLAIVQKRSPEVPYRVVRGFQVGLKALPTTRAPRFDFMTVPMSASWSLTFKYFEPDHQKAVTV